LTVKESRSPSDYIPNLTNLAGQGNDLVIAVGFLMESAIGKVAKQYPNVNFAIVDDSVTAKSIGGAKNVEGLLFSEQQAGYLAGYLVGSLIKSGTYAPLKGATTISSVGGIAVPSVVRYIAGYQHGATDADPGIKLLNGYSQDFVDKSKCKALAEAQIAQGSKVVFQVAGNCGAGALAAAGEKKVLGIGVDINQAPLGPQILTSAIKKVDEAVYGAAQQVASGTIKGGTDTIFSLDKGGVGIEGTKSDVPADILAQVKAVQDKITSGALTVPQTPIKN
jgi:basic membrane protein A